MLFFHNLWNHTFSSMFYWCLLIPMLIWVFVTSDKRVMSKTWCGFTWYGYDKLYLRSFLSFQGAVEVSGYSWACELYLSQPHLSCILPAGNTLGPDEQSVSDEVVCKRITRDNNYNLSYINYTLLYNLGFTFISEACPLTTLLVMWISSWIKSLWGGSL